MAPDILPEGFVVVPLEDAPPAEAEPRLRSVTAAELLTMSLPPRACALEPVMPLPGLAMIYAPRGIGKTFTALSIALAIASGGAALKWRAPAPRRVLYVDGEMPAQQLQERLARLLRSTSTHPPEADFLRFIAADLAPEGLPSIARPETQRALEAEMAATGGRSGHS
jgi:putative DNA primase/helicase